ncbi:nuclear transport factor 2 family protein [Mesorhizobium tianshanense]|nr:nuclear transport factor 2 family protein [Mesorhizobium tianshanense]
MNKPTRSSMPSRNELLKRLYDSFNSRDLEGALAAMHSDVMWANGLDGGHVHGHDEVREYWQDQWKKMDSRAEPLEYHDNSDGTAYVDVHLTARDHDGKLLFDTQTRHMFRFEGSVIRRFDIG